MANEVEAIVIGAGHSGLNTSRALQKRGVEHVVLERGRVGETWRNQRWRSFRLNTPNWANPFVDWDYDGEEPGAFCSHRDLVERLESYVDRYDLPVRDDTEVVSVRRSGDEFEVTTADDRWLATNVVLCTGIQNVPRRPDFAGSLPRSIEQFHAAEYESPDDVPDGGVLVVGGGQTGVQLAEDLIDAGRDTYLCTSKVGRGPRRYRGRDLLEWVEEIGMGSQTVDDLPDPKMQYVSQPHVSGTRGGHTLSLQMLGRKGVTLLGRLQDVDGTRLSIGDDLLENVGFADEVSGRLKQMVDDYIEKAGVEAPDPEPNPAEAPFEELDEMAGIRSLDLEAESIATVIWATGFGGDFSFVELDLDIDEHGFPAHDEGASHIAGLYFAGFPWLRTRQSGILIGAARDAEAIAERIVAG